MSARFAMLLALTGCFAHGSAVPPLPSQGGPAWVEVTSPHFVMWTDAPAARGRALIHTMEQHRQIVLGIEVHDERAAAKSFVIALRDGDEVAAYVPRQFIAYAVGSPNPLWTPIVVVAADTSDDNLHVLTHELTHVIMDGVVPHEPHWFAEGIATYFETTRIDRAGTSAEIGRPLDHIAGWLRTHHPIPLESLFACTIPACMNADFYATAWAFFAYLFNEHPAELVAYMARLREERGAKFTAFPTAQLDHELARWLAYGHTLVSRYKLDLRDPAVADRALADREALAARSILRFVFPVSAADTRAAVDAALAADPTSVVGNLLLRSVAGALPVAAARAVAEAHPDDWRAWWLLGFTARTGPDSIEARAKLCALVGGDLPDGVPAQFCATR